MQDFWPACQSSLFHENYGEYSNNSAKKEKKNKNTHNTRNYYLIKNNNHKSEYIFLYIRSQSIYKRYITARECAYCTIGRFHLQICFINIYYSFQTIQSINYNYISIIKLIHFVPDMNLRVTKFSFMNFKIVESASHPPL